MKTIKELTEKLENIQSTLNNTISAELLKDDNMVGSPRHLKEEISINNISYKCYRDRVDDALLDHRVKVTLSITDDFKYRGAPSRIECTLVRSINCGIVENNTKVKNVKVYN